jgi:hypothetical protein
MFGFGKNTTSDFEAAEERIRKANADLRENLTALRDAAGSDASHVLLFNVGAAGLGTLAETVSTLMACVYALSARVAFLENQ